MKIKTYEELIDIVKDYQYGENILIAAKRLVWRAGRRDVEYAPIRNERFMKSLVDEVRRDISPGWLTSNPVEMFQAEIKVCNRTGRVLTEADLKMGFSFRVEREAFNIFGIFGTGGKQKKVLDGIYKFGEDAGLWKHFAGQPKGKMGGVTDPKSLIPTKLILTGSWWRGSLVEFEIQNKNIRIKMEKAKVNIDLDALNQKNGVLSVANAEFSKLITWPTQESVFDAAIARKLLPPKDCGRPFEKDELDLFSSILEWGARDWEETEAAGYQSICKKTSTILPSRIYTRFNGAPRIIRAMAMIKNEPVVTVDIKACHPAIFSKICIDNGVTPPDFFSGDAHTKLADTLGVSRNVAKEINLVYLNFKKYLLERWDAPENFAYLSDMHELMRQNYPEALTLIEKISDEYRFIDAKTGKVAKKHARLCRILFYWEVMVIGRAIETLNEKGIAADSCHDSIAVAKSNENEAKNALDESLLFYGVPTYSEIQK